MPHSSRCTWILTQQRGMWRSKSFLAWRSSGGQGENQQTALVQRRSFRRRSMILPLGNPSE
jgi:hypothetical protein